MEKHIQNGNQVVFKACTYFKYDNDYSLNNYLFPSSDRDAAVDKVPFEDFRKLQLFPIFLELFLRHGLRQSEINQGKQR